MTDELHGILRNVLGCFGVSEERAMMAKGRCLVGIWWGVGENEGILAVLKRGKESIF